MSVVAQVEQQEPSPLASARLQRKLTVDEAARRAGLTADQIEWLEEGRVYRFPSADGALVAVVLYATALGIDQDEARGLARLPVEPRPERYPRNRIVSVAAGVVVLVALAVTLLGGFGGDAKKRKLETTALPPPWKFSVDVLNGGGDIYYTRALASKACSLDKGERGLWRSVIADQGAWSTLPVRPLDQGRAQFGDLRLQLRRHRLHHCLADEAQ